jgi:hypothetical protein
MPRTGQLSIHPKLDADQAGQARASHKHLLSYQYFPFREADSCTKLAWAEVANLTFYLKLTREMLDNR